MSRNWIWQDFISGYCTHRDIHRGCCYYFPYENVVFSGDTLFCTSVGRTDFPGGSMSDIIRSIKEKLMTLPHRTTVYPGHNDVTTIENERMYNPYL